MVPNLGYVINFCGYARFKSEFNSEQYLLKLSGGANLFIVVFVGK